MKTTKTLLGIMLALSFVGSADAGVLPRPGTLDGRVKTITYNANNVISLKGFYGYQTTIKFAPYEKIQNISIGDSVAWQVVPNKAGNLLFVKPVEERATTNMAVITDRRVYNFELTSGLAYSPSDPNITYMLTFNYPQESVIDFSRKNGSMTASYPGARPYGSRIEGGTVSSVGAPKDLNFNYSYKGKKSLSPIMVFDNGEFTFFKFRDTDNLPAIFAVDNNRNESVVNYHMDGGYLVVERLAPQFTLRIGKEEACVFNDNIKTKRPLFAMKKKNKKLKGNK